MKYKAGIEKKMMIIKQKAVESDSSYLKLSNILPVAAKVKIVAMIIITKYLRSFLFKTLPSLFKKFLCSSKETLANLLTVKGTAIIVSQNKAEDRYIFEFANKNEQDIPTLIPSQNIKFQKLSLFSLSLMNFILSSLTCSIRSSITYFGKIYQTILKIMGVCLAASALLLLSFAHVYASVQEANTEEAAQEHLTKTLDISSLISNIEKEYNIPKNLLRSIAKVESNLNPNALNIRGKSMIFNSKEEAIETIKSYLVEKVKNIDIGLMQINYHYHSKQFDQLGDMLDPEKNIKYAAELLCDLYNKHKTWHKAVRYYHSANRVHHYSYSKKVLVSWLSA